MRVIDLRSDTITQPTDEMRRAMAEAEVGDDVYGEDPSMNRLQERAAALLGKEAGLFTASGTMSNLIATLTYCHRGDEMVMGDQSHMYWNESAGVTGLAGAQSRLLPNDSQGRIDPGDLEAAIRPKGNIHFPPTTMVCLENTHNRCSGGVLTPEDTAKVAEVAHAAGANVHLDGARIFNAAVALGVDVKDLAKDADSVMFCLSKGLSAPVGSLTCGENKFIQRARKWRKMLGGGMRQSGYLAAAGIIALNGLVDRLKEDHANAQILAQGLSRLKGVVLDPQQIKTNIIFFSLKHPTLTSETFLNNLETEGVKILMIHPGIFRAVLYREISESQIKRVISISEGLVK